MSVCDIYNLSYIFEGTIWQYNHVHTFEEGSLLSKTLNNAESSDKSDENPIIPPLLNKEEMDAMGVGDGPDDDRMYA